MSRRMLVAAAISMSAIWCGNVSALAAQNAQQRQSVAPAASVSILETQWNLVELDGAAVSAAASQSQPYIYLQEQGDKLSGSAGCNRLFGSFDLSGKSLQFHSVASTRMACAGDSMEHESALFEALKLTTSYEISGNMLQLRVEDRLLARFQAEKKK